MKNRYFSIGIALICIIVFIFQQIIPGLTDVLLLNKNAVSGEIWRFLTSIFLHANLSHLVLNLFALIMFGLILEKLIGSKRFLIIYFSAGILANIFAVFFYSNSLGASGAIFGIIGALAVIRPLMTVWVFNLPLPMFVAAIIWAGIDILGVLFPTDVGNIAHLTGLAAGLALGFYFRIKHFRNLEVRANYARINIPENYMRDWEDRFLGK